MAFFGRLKTGFALARRSVHVLRDHPRLVVFPAVAGVAGLAYFAVLFGAVVSVDRTLGEVSVYVALFCFYLGSTFVASFFTAGLLYCSRQAFRGETPRIRDGLRAASRNLVPLFAWAVVSAVVGVLVRALEENETPLSTVTAAVFSVAWTVTTYFVVPVVVFEDVGVLEMFSRSKDTVVATWGESMGAVGSVGLVTVALAVLGAIPGVVLLATLGGLTAFAVLAAGVLLAALVGQTLVGVAKAALYVYATEDEAPDYFDGIDFGGNGGDGHKGPLPGTGGVV